MANRIKIADVFSEIPGGRYKSDGPHSGEEFREIHLVAAFKSLKPGQKVLIDFDGAYGYPTSFLEEAFGGLARMFGAQEVLAKLEFKSSEEPGLVDEVRGYIKNASASN